MAFRGVKGAFVNHLDYLLFLTSMFQCFLGWLKVYIRIHLYLPTRTYRDLYGTLAIRVQIKSILRNTHLHICLNTMLKQISSHEYATIIWIYNLTVLYHTLTL